MLAQNFKTADDLGIAQHEFEALAKTLVLLETGKLRHVPDDNAGEMVLHTEAKFNGLFNMNLWGNKTDCGTVACIGGTAQLIGRFEFREMPDALDDLFYPDSLPLTNWNRITTSQAATALRSYLTTGDARWDLAVQL
jgi:hypothetical protein